VTWSNRNLNEKHDGTNLPAWAKGYLLAQGILVTLLSLSLMVVPDIMVSVWPWKITRLLAQIYAAPFLSYGLGSLMLRRRQTWNEARVVLSGTVVFAICVLVASILHRNLFSLSNASTWIWFGGFAIATSVLGFMTARSMQEKPQ
jgi:hypothetical protein